MTRSSQQASEATIALRWSRGEQLVKNGADDQS
jgi:hypothetical protein